MTMEMAPDGATYEYKFLTAGAWGDDEANNRSVTIADSGDGTMMIPLNCFNEMAACTNMGVTLRVDLNDKIVANEFDPANDIMNVAGTIPGISWTPTENPMTDADGDNVWEINLPNVDPGDYQYKFVINDGGWEGGAVGDCPGGADGNRSSAFNGNTTRPIVCFDKCGDCELTVAPEKYLVTFQVDMSNQLAQFDALDTVYVAGAFQSWTPGTSPMVDDGTLGDAMAGDGIFTRQDSLIDGTYGYKFIYGDDWGFDETGLATCNGNGDRSLTVEGGDLAIPSVCFNTCDPTCPALAAPINVTFVADLSNEIPDANGVYVKGSFQWPQFRDSVTALEPIGNGIYESAPITLRPGEITFQYSNGPVSDDNENFAFTDNGCGETNTVGTQLRLVDLTGVTQDTVIGYVYNTCTEFIVSNTTEISTAQNFRITPNPFTNQTIIQFDNINNTIHQLMITDITGKLIKSINNIRDNQVTISRDAMPAGVYFATLSNEKGELVTQKIIAH